MDATKGTTRIARPELSRRLADLLETRSLLLVAGAGYGKTMALEEALERSGRRAAWVSCEDSGGDSGLVFAGTVEALRAAVPGLADVLGDRLAASVWPVEVRYGTGALVEELERLLAEPLVIVFDDAHELERADDAMALVDRLLNSPDLPLSVAVATRTPLPFKLAKLRAAGRLAEIGPADLCFTAAECEELLRLRHGRAVTEDEVEAAVAASEGWPMGVALSGLAGSAGTGAISREELFRFLAEDVLERLDPEMRLAVVDSSVPAALTPELERALGLPAGFTDEAERLGLFVRTEPSGARSYHPLFRSFLLERLEERPAAGRAALHARAATTLLASGDSVAAIGHWLDAGHFEVALSVIADNAPELFRTSPATIGAWLARLPPEFHDDPDYLCLKALLVWGAGQHDQVLDPLRAAVSGYRRTGDVEREWFARLVLADALISLGAFDDVGDLVKGWDDVRSAGARPIAGAVAWYHAIALIGRGLPEQAEALAGWLRDDEATTEQFRDLDGIARVGLEPAAGRGTDTIAWLDDTIALLERDDSYARLPYAIAMAVLVLRDLGLTDAALEYLDRCEREAARFGMGFVARDCQLQRALLLAQRGDLAHAEIELARAGPRRGVGWRGVHRGEAEANVAALRGDSAEAVAAAQRALERVAPGPICYRVWTAVDLAPLLAENGEPELARHAVDEIRKDLDARFPGPRGRYHRARLLATRAILQYRAGEIEAACQSVSGCWGEAGAEAEHVVRAHWRTLRPVLWESLARGAVSPDVVVPAVRDAFPGGEALVAMVDHPEPAVRRVALKTALVAGHPAVVERLVELSRDADEQVASAAAATQQRVRVRPPQLRFELLGGFRVKRAGWELDEATWKRPMAARVVRFLLVQGDVAVPEDALFEAFWADRDADAARQHLAQAVSRARKVLDLAGVPSSLIEAKERVFRLRLGERDSIDSAEFERAAASALRDRGSSRRKALERAAGLWTGEPLPEDRYAPWTFAWRERLVETYSEVLGALAESYEQSGEHHDTIRTARALLEVNPLDELAHRRLMVAYARTGRTSHALRQYLECRRALVVEMGVEPSAATSRLQARILAGEPV